MHLSSLAASPSVAPLSNDPAHRGSNNNGDYPIHDAKFIRYNNHTYYTDKPYNRLWNSKGPRRTLLVPIHSLPPASA